jgi:N utilization substance protein A
LSSEALWKSTKSVLDGLDSVISKSDQELVIDVFRDIVPAVNNGMIRIKKVSRRPQTLTKVLLESDSCSVNVIGTCIGQDGNRIKRIASALGGGTVHLVDANANYREMVASALGIHNLPAGSIFFDSEERPSIARIQPPANMHGLIIGTGGVNIMLASQLLDIKIEVLQGEAHL